MKHENIVRCEDVYFTKAEDLCVVMEVLDGGSNLEAAIKVQEGTTFPEERIVFWFRQICEALRMIHASGAIHRDIRPINMSLTRESNIKVGEFQVYTHWNIKSVKSTDQFYYLAPELLMGNEPTAMSDVWALGVMLYELCYLKKPFDNGPQLIIETKIKQGSLTWYDDSCAEDEKFSE